MCTEAKAEAVKTDVLKNWADFRPLIEKIRRQYEYCGRGEYREENRLLFRGVSSSKWHLETTLERVTKDRQSVTDYMRYAARCSDELGSMFGQKWNIPPFPELEKEIRAKQDYGRVHLPCYDYLVYLRHHGFPSPLLDWTTSPYIAAYFAFFERPVTDCVSVYVYIETPEGFKTFGGGDPKIHVMGPYVTTHRRHFVQKAWYTVATQFDKEKEDHYFCPHTDIFATARNNQDVLVRITMPATERAVGLRELDDHNINHFTLFQTEDALVKALAMREFELRVT